MKIRYIPLAAIVLIACFFLLTKPATATDQTQAIIIKDTQWVVAYQCYYREDPEVDSPQGPSIWGVRYFALKPSVREAVSPEGWYQKIITGQGILVRNNNPLLVYPERKETQTILNLTSPEMKDCDLSIHESSLRWVLAKPVSRENPWHEVISVRNRGGEFEHAKPPIPHTYSQLLRVSCPYSDHYSWVWATERPVVEGRTLRLGEDSVVWNPFTSQLLKTGQIGWFNSHCHASYYNEPVRVGASVREEGVFLTTQILR